MLNYGSGLKIAPSWKQFLKYLIFSSLAAAGALNLFFLLTCFCFGPLLNFPKNCVKGFLVVSMCASM